MSQLHVVFGAGQVGTLLAQLLQGRGHRVRGVRRSARPVAPGIEVVSADAMQPAEVLAASAGAAVLYHCMNPSAYTHTAWEAEFPRMGEALIAAAQHHGARLVCLDNLYGYGETDAPRSEVTPMRAAGRKGQVRVAWDARLRAAGAAGLRWTAGRAGDFFGPGAGDQSLMSVAAVQKLGQGWPALLIGDVDAPHAFSYVPDVVAGLAALGAAPDEVEGRAWHLPVLTVSPRALARHMAQAQGRRGWVFPLSAGLIRTLRGVVPLFGMLHETLYQWDRPFLVEDGAFRARFPGIGATLEQAVAETVAVAAAQRPAEAVVLAAV